jgi:hypothetical protein
MAELYSKKKPTPRKPRKFGVKLKLDTSKPRRKTHIYPWRSKEIRVYIIAGQTGLRNRNPQFADHADYGGYGPNSLAGRLTDDMKTYYPEAFEHIASYCDEGFKNHAGVRKRLYDRIVKTTQGKDRGGSTNNEHYDTWGKGGRRGPPVTADEKQRADNILARALSLMSN